MIEVNVLGLAGRTVPFYVPWPRVGDPGAICEFATPDEWLTFLTGFDLNANVPQVVATKYSRALRLYALSWLDFDLIKAGELVAITALEMALKDRYASLIPKERPMLGDLLRHLVVKDGLGTTELSFTRRYGGRAADLLYESTEKKKARQAYLAPAQPTLLSIRNGLAHGDPFDGLPWGGLLELIRDLIEYAYRGMIAEAPPSAIQLGRLLR